MWVPGARHGQLEELGMKPLDHKKVASTCDGQSVGQDALKPAECNLHRATCVHFGVWQIAQAHISICKDCADELVVVSRSASLSGLNLVQFLSPTLPRHPAQSLSVHGFLDVGQKGQRGCGAWSQQFTWIVGHELVLQLFGLGSCEA